MYLLCQELKPKVYLILLGGVGMNVYKFEAAKETLEKIAKLKECLVTMNRRYSPFDGISEELYKKQKAEAAEDIKAQIVALEKEFESL